MDGLRRASVVNTSRSAAASRDVITAIVRGRRAEFVSFRIEQALFFELVTEPKEGLEQGAEACAPHGFDIELEIARGSYKLTSACTSICIPSRGVHSRFCLRCRT